MATFEVKHGIHLFDLFDLRILNLILVKTIIKICFKPIIQNQAHTETNLIARVRYLFTYISMLISNNITLNTLQR